MIVARSRAVYTALAPNRFQGLLAGVSGSAEKASIRALDGVAARHYFFRLIEPFAGYSALRILRSPSVAPSTPLDEPPARKPRQHAGPFASSSLPRNTGWRRLLENIVSSTPRARVARRQCARRHRGAHARPRVHAQNAGRARPRRTRKRTARSIEAGDKTIKIVRVEITAAGRRAIEVDRALWRQRSGETIEVVCLTIIDIDRRALGV